MACNHVTRQLCWQTKETRLFLSTSMAAMKLVNRDRTTKYEAFVVQTK